MFNQIRSDMVLFSSSLYVAAATVNTDKNKNRLVSSCSKVDILNPDNCRGKATLLAIGNQFKKNKLHRLIKNPFVFSTEG